MRQRLPILSSSICWSVARRRRGVSVCAIRGRSCRIERLRRGSRPHCSVRRLLSTRRSASRLCFALRHFSKPEKSSRRTMDLRTLKGTTMFSVSGLPRMASQMQRNLCDHHRCQHQHGQRPAVPCAPGMFHLVLDVSESLCFLYFFGFFFDDVIQQPCELG